MNTIFKEKRIIPLLNGFRLEPDGFNGVELIFEETRQKTKKDTLEKVDYQFVDKWYFPKVSMALEKYVALSQNQCNTIDEILLKTNQLLETIKTK